MSVQQHARRPGTTASSTSPDSIVSVLVTTTRSLLSVFILLLFARLVLDLIQSVSPQWRPRGAVLWIAEVVYTVTDPPVKFVRRFVPPLRLGPVMLDLSFLILLFSTQMLSQLLAHFA